MIARTTKLVPPAKSVFVRRVVGHQGRDVHTCEFVKFERKGDREEE